MSKNDKNADKKEVNVPLNFTWSKNKQLKATVFKKRGKSELEVNESEKKGKRKEFNFVKKRVGNENSKDKITMNKTSPDKINNNIKNANNTIKGIEKNQYVKRKWKKEKLLAKQQGNEDNLNTSQQTARKNKSYSLFSETEKECYIDIKEGHSVSEKVFATSGKKFSDLSIHKYLISNLEKNNFVNLTNVQEKSIPFIMEGKNVLIRSQTGSGKTLAYAVPIIDALQSLTPKLQRKDGVQAMIVVPTRELALQTHEIFNKINTFQSIIVGHLCGGENRKSEKDRLRKGINVIVGTPGRLLDHALHTNAFKIDNVRCLVLDEADRLLDMGFRKDIVSLVERLDNVKDSSGYDPLALLRSGLGGKHSKINQEYTEKNEKIDEEINEYGKTREEVKEEIAEGSPLKNMRSKKRQTILLSATLTKAVSELAEFTMKDHIYVDALDEENEAPAGNLVIPSTVKQEFILTYVKHRLFTLSALIVAKSKENAKTFVFMASSQMVDYHYELFNRCLFKMPVNRGKLKMGNVALLEEDAEDSSDEEEVVLDMNLFKLHGSMDQKSRKEVFNKFRAAKKGILLCTDVAARGLDVPEADCIIQYNGPQTDEDYLHRVGRTGRVGKSGSALIFLTHEEQEYVNRLREYKVFLKKKDPAVYLKHLCDLMEEQDYENAAIALQKRYEYIVAKDKELYTSACFAYSSWSRFYNAYPMKMRKIFDFKTLNLGHYVTSFAIRDTPSQVAKVVRGQVANFDQPRLNKKLANHEIVGEVGGLPKKGVKTEKKNKKRSMRMITSEFDSGLEPMKKKKKE